MGDESTLLLRRLLGAWKTSRDPVLEPWIDKAGVAIARRRGPPKRGEPAWHELAKARDVGDLDRLLDGSWDLTREEALARITALAGWPPDPRIARALANAGRQFVGHDDSDVHRAIAAAIVKTPSMRLLPAIDAIEAARSAQATRLIYAPARHAIATLSPTPADDALIERARTELGSDDDLEALFEQLGANPGDLALRGVIADRLQAVGDPRGDFIALQLDGSPAALRRASKLLATHIETWTGPLPGVVPESRRFERGFLTGAFVHLDPGLARSFESGTWSTLEELGIGGAKGDVAGLVARLPLLRLLHAPRWAVERVVDAGLGKTIQTLVTNDMYVPLRREALPALRVLYWSSSNLTAKLLRLAAELGVRAVGHETWDAAEVGRVLGLARGLTLELRFMVGDSIEHLTASGWQIKIAADRSAAELQFSGRRGREHLAAILEVLARAGIPRLILCEPGPAARATVKAFRGTIGGAAIELRAARFDFLG